jgi:hypothetical protein
VTTTRFGSLQIDRRQVIWVGAGLITIIAIADWLATASSLSSCI